MADTVSDAARPPRILLIDDEARILSFLSRGLRGEGFDGQTASDGSTGLEMALVERYDVVVLDLLLPGLDGTSLLQSLLGRKPDQSVIVLSALIDTASKVRVLQLGAEDYLAKPFSLDELVARIRARLRGQARSVPATLSSPRLTLDLIRRRADSGSGLVTLADREFLLLRELLQCVGQTLSKQRLQSAVWGYYFDPGSNVVDVYVRRLRAKLGRDVVTTVRGAGYRIDAD